MYDPNDPDNMPRSRLAAEVKALREIALVAREVLIVCEHLLEGERSVTEVQVMAMAKLDAAVKRHELAISGSSDVC